MKRIFSLAWLTLFILNSCTKEKTAEFLPGDKGELEVEFDNVMGVNDLLLNAGSYTNAAGEVYTISTLNYYISNIKLKNTDGSEYTVPQDSSYFLIKEENASQRVLLENIPAGNYKGISFTLGVDSLKSIAPLWQRTGVLDPASGAAGMYWDQNEGYIFLKFDGSSNAANTSDKKFHYQVGGYGGNTTPTYNNIKQVSLSGPAGAMAMVRKNKPTAPHIHIFTDAAKIMNGIVNLSIAAHSTVGYDAYSVTIANNCAGMFKIDHIHND